MNRINELHEANIKRKKLDVRKILGIPASETLSSSSATTLEKAKYQATESDRKSTESAIPTNRESFRDAKNRTHFGNPPASVENKFSGKRKLEGDDYRNDQDNLEGADGEVVTMISVLRLLTAFEDMLGSLGSKVVDLLSKAVAVEKVRPNLSEELLMSSENSVLLETVKEKLKGLILAGMVQGKREEAIRKAIRNLGEIVRLIDSKPREQPKENSTNVLQQSHDTGEVSKSTVCQSNRVPGATTLASSPEKATKPSISEAKRRSDVLRQLATSLMLQGRNISNEHMEELVSVYLANCSSTDTPYLFGLEMGNRLAKMENEQKPTVSVSTKQSFSSFQNNDQKTSPNIQQHRNNDPLAVSNYGSTSNDQQLHFAGKSTLQPQVQTVRDNLGWKSSSAFGIGDIDNGGSGSQSHHQSEMQSNNERWPNPQATYNNSIQQPYQKTISQYSNISSGYDQMKGLPSWSGNEQTMPLSHLQSQYQGNQQASQGQPYYQQLQQNSYCQRPNINIGHQQNYPAQNPMNPYPNQMYQNISQGLNQAQLQTAQHQWWPNAAGR